jgi:hypothetical protein
MKATTSLPSTYLVETWLPVESYLFNKPQLSSDVVETRRALVLDAHRRCQRPLDGHLRLTYLERARGVPIDINHGIRDGHGGGPVPISQSLRAFNLLAAPNNRLTEEEIEYFTREAKVPPHLRSEASGASAGGLKVLFRRQSGNARLTVFDGGHDKHTEAAFRWLHQQRNR